MGQALPIGNGRAGAMVFGDPARERLQINEDTTRGAVFAVDPQGIITRIDL